MRTGIIYHCLAVAALVVSGCDKKSDERVSDAQMVNIMTDMEIAEAYLQSHATSGDINETRERMFTYILEKHKVSRESFDASLEWYGLNMDDYDKLYERVDKKLNARQKSIAKNIVVEDAPLNDIWTYARHAVLSGNETSDGVSFSIPAIDIEKGSKLQWQMRLSKASTGSIMMGVEYDNGKYSYLNERLMGSKDAKIVVQTDTSKVVKRVFGYLMLTERAEMPIFADSIRLNVLPFDSTTYFRYRSQKTFYPVNRAVKDSVPSAEADSLKNYVDGNAVTNKNNEISYSKPGSR